MSKILFVCTGNVCRSPMAEGLFLSMIRRGEGISVQSAGISAMPGHPPSQYSIQVLQRDGIDISGLHSKQLTPEMVEEASHIFTMSLSHKIAIENYFPSAAEKTFLVRELSEDAHPDFILQGALDVPDPIGQSIEAYELTRDLIKEALPAVVDFVRQTGD